MPVSFACAAVATAAFSVPLDAFSLPASVASEEVDVAAGSAEAAPVAAEACVLADALPAGFAAVFVVAPDVEALRVACSVEEARDDSPAVAPPVDDRCAPAAGLGGSEHRAIRLGAVRRRIRFRTIVRLRYRRTIIARRGLSRSIRVRTIRLRAVRGRIRFRTIVRLCCRRTVVARRGLKRPIRGLIRWWICAWTFVTRAFVGGRRSRRAIAGLISGLVRRWISRAIRRLIGRRLTRTISRLIRSRLRGGFTHGWLSRPSRRRLLYQGLCSGRVSRPQALQFLSGDGLARMCGELLLLRGK